jgi:hypothetical protein
MNNQILSKMYQTFHVSAVEHCRSAIHALYPIGAFAGSGESERFQVSSLCRVKPASHLNRVLVYVLLMTGGFIFLLLS